METKPSKPFDPIGTLLRHWLKIVVFGSVLFILFSPLPIIKKAVFYKTDGKLLVTPNVQALITNTEDKSISGSYSTYIKTLCEQINSQENLTNAINSLDPEIKTIFAPNQEDISDAAISLGNRLQIEHTYGTYFISISLEGSRPEGLAAVINASMDAFLEQTALESEGKESRRLEYLEAEKARVETEIADLTKQYKSISMEVGTMDFREVGNIQNTILEGLQQKYIDAYTLRITKENEMKAAIREAAALQSLSIDAEVEDFVLRSSVASEMDIQTYQQIQELKESLEGLAENNPDRQIIEDQIENLSDSLDYLKDMLKTQTRQILESKRNATLQEKIILAQTGFEAAQAAEQELKEKIDSVMSNKMSISNKILDGQQIETEIENCQVLLTRLEERINVLRLEARAPGRISIATQALKPKGPAGSNFKKLIMYCFILAFGGVTFICVFFDICDKRVRSRKNIMDALGAKVTWPISNYDLTKTEDIPFARATLDDSLNVVSKAMHSLTIRLDKERRENQAKIAVFTGVDANSGTTEILINVAYAMTKLCGRVLVLDANLVNPGLDRLLSMEHISPGLVDLLTSQENYEKCIFRNDERGFDVMPAGQVLPLNEINLIDRSRITNLLSMLKDQYDFILIDTIPILVSDLTEFFALQTDVVTLNVQGDRSGYDGLAMAGEIFSRLQIKAIAVVLNWGGPRERNFLQVAVSKLLKPITKRIVRSPIWDIRHLSSQSQSNGAGKWNLSGLLKMIMARIGILSQKTSKKLLVFFITGGLLFAMGGYVLKASSSDNDVDVLKAQAPIVEYPVMKSKETDNTERVPSSSEHHEKSDGERYQADLSTVHRDVEVVDLDTEAIEKVGSEEDPQSNSRKAEANEEGGQAQKSATESDSNSFEKRGSASRVDGSLHFEKESFASSEEYILSLPENLYTIQLMGYNDRDYLVGISKICDIGDESVCFQKKKGSSDWYVLIYKLFSDRLGAVESEEGLVPGLKAYGPWIRKIADIQREIIESGDTDRTGQLSASTDSFPKR